MNHNKAFGKFGKKSVKYTETLETINDVFPDVNKFYFEFPDVMPSRPSIYFKTRLATVVKSTITGTSPRFFEATNLYGVISRDSNIDYSESVRTYIDRLEAKSLSSRYYLDTRFEELARVAMKVRDLDSWTDNTPTLFAGTYNISPQLVDYATLYATIPVCAPHRTLIAGMSEGIEPIRDYDHIHPMFFDEMRISADDLVRQSSLYDILPIRSPKRNVLGVLDSIGHTRSYDLSKLIRPSCDVDNMAFFPQDLCDETPLSMADHDGDSSLFRKIMRQYEAFRPIHKSIYYSNKSDNSCNSLPKTVSTNVNSLLARSKKD